MRKILFILTFFSATVSSQAISIEEFITYCDTICDVNPIRLSSDSVAKLKAEKVESVIVFNLDSISDEMKQNIIDIANNITRTEDMIVVRHNESEDVSVQVFIKPEDDKVAIAVIFFGDEDNVIVYVKGDNDLLKVDNIVNVNGKDLVKEALNKNKQEQQE